MTKVGVFLAKIVAIVNQKGGVGKTTTCVNLTSSLKEKGNRVLLCDFDPQANSTSGMGVDKAAVVVPLELLFVLLVHARFPAGQARFQRGAHALRRCAPLLESPGGRGY